MSSVTKLLICALCVVIHFQISESDYVAVEGEDNAVQVRVTRDHDVLLANPVSLRVTPLTVPQAMSRHATAGFEMGTPFSPAVASRCDEW